MIKIRLKRMGAKKRPSYRIIVADSRSPRDGRFIENLGNYDPLAEPAQVKINHERASYWFSVGAQPTDTVRSIMVREGVLTQSGKLKQPPVAATAAEATTA